jgi:hypothetical protein
MQQSPSYWKVPDMLPHNEFVFAYENGSLGCSVSTLLTLRLFFAGKIRQKKVATGLFLWSVGFLVLIGASLIAFIRLPVFWALAGTIVALVIYTLAFFYWGGELILSSALASEEFYLFATAERALWLYSEDEKNLPKAQNPLPMRRVRRTRR